MTRKYKKKPVFQRILNRLKINQETKCWEWIGYLKNDGYSRITINGKTQKVHRIIYKIFYGKIPEDKPCVLHRCDNPKCCNPLHLYAGTKKDNSNDRLKRNPNSWPKGEKNHQAKLTEKQIINIRKSIKSLSVIAKKYNVGNSTIWNIKNRKTWKHIQ